MAVWDDDTKSPIDPPDWLFTGHMLLWGDGSPAHIDMEPFRSIDGGGMGSEPDGQPQHDAGHAVADDAMRLSPAVRAEWESDGKSARARALQVLASYLRLTEWYEDDIGLLELK
jgi:hypothetical protein